MFIIDSSFLMSRQYRVAIVGATGAVGIEILHVMERRKFPAASVKLLASARSAGKTLKFRGEELASQTLGVNSFEDVDLAFFSAGAAISREYAEIAVQCGAVVIDNSSAFRMQEERPLVIPEINPRRCRTPSGDHRQSKLHDRNHADGALSSASQVPREKDLCLQLPGCFGSRRAEPSRN